MLKNNCTKLEAQNTILVIIMLLAVTITGMTFFKVVKNDSEQVSKKEIIIEPKEFKDTKVSTTLAYSDNITIEVNEATQVQKISSRASSIRRAKNEATNFVTVDQVSISRGMDLNIRTGLSREDFINLIAGVRADTSGFFEENAGLIYDLCEIYNINEIFFCGLISAESGWNIAGNHRRTNNYISLMTSSGLIHFATVEEGLEAAAKALHNNYLTPGGKFYRGSTLEGVRTIFCSENPGWTELVYGRMSQIL